MLPSLQCVLHKHYKGHADNLTDPLLHDPVVKLLDEAMPSASSKTPLTSPLLIT